MSTPAATPAEPRRNTPKDPGEIEREIHLRQQRLAASVDELHVRLSPKDMARRGSAGARAKVRAALYDERGSLRVERVVAIGAAALTVIGWVVWRRH